MAALARRGWPAVASAVLTVEGTGKAAPSTPKPDAVVITSGNALRMARGDGVLSRWTDIPVWAVGEQTAGLGRQMGLKTVHSADGDGRALLRLCAANLDPASEIIHVTGERLGEDLSAGLTALGHSVIRWENYRTATVSRWDMQTRWLIGRRRVGVALLLSPRSATAFATLMGKHDLWNAAAGMRLACISEPTANALLDSMGPKPLLTVCIAQEPTLSGTIDAIL